MTTLEEKMIANPLHQQVFVLQKSLEGELLAGKLYGVVSSHIAWTPTDETGETGNLIPFFPEFFVEPFFKKLK